MTNYDDYINGLQVQSIFWNNGEIIKSSSQNPFAQIKDVSKNIDFLSFTFDDLCKSIVEFVDKNVPNSSIAFRLDTEYVIKMNKLDYFKGFKTYEQLKQDMLKLYALDIYMMQLDRADVNIQLEKKDDSLRLAPVFDYSAAYMCSHKRYLEYYNYMYSMNIEKMDEVFNKYPELYNYLKQLDNVDFLKLLKQEMEKYELKKPIFFELCRNGLFEDDEYKWNKG